VNCVVKIRLRRIGAKRQPSYRVVVADSEDPQGGSFIENIGQYNPRTEPAILTVNEERVLYWLSKGAQPTEVVGRMLKKLGVMDKFAAQKSLAGARSEAEAVSGGAA
jgi:small subunit ribosomal protein S16